MADYDLSRLSPRCFEQLVQAIAAVVIGPGIVAFGDGPDGGREAVFDSRIPYPHDTDPWHGYGVVQAKYRQRAEGNGKDADWALQELKKELDKFADPERKLRKPEYYIFATNVVLSPVAEKGAKDRAAAFFARYKTTVPIKGFRLWDYDQLRTFLDNCEDIRHAYTAWITPGDVLAEVINRLKPQRPDFQEVMTNHVSDAACERSNTLRAIAVKRFKPSQRSEVRSRVAPAGRNSATQRSRIGRKLRSAIRGPPSNPGFRPSACIRATRFTLLDQVRDLIRLKHYSIRTARGLGVTKEPQR